MILTFFEIGQVIRHGFDLWILGVQAPDPCQNIFWAVCFEVMQLLIQPSLAGRIIPFPYGLTNGMEVLSGMRKIQNAHSILAMKIDKTLFPFGPVGDSRYLLGIFYPLAMARHQGHSPKDVCFGDAREIRVLLAVYYPFSLLQNRRLDFPDGQGLDFRPYPSH